MPREVILNPNEPSYEWINDPNFGEIIDEVFEIGYFIPFLESVQQFLSIKVVFDAVMLNFSSYDSSANPTDYSDVLSGSYIKKHPLYIKHNGQILCFQVYMDEVEVSNPLGSKKGKHKICVFYWTLLNIPPIFRSSLRSIQLLGIVSNDLLKDRGVEVFLKPFIDDLILLLDGVTLTIRNQKRKWFGMLVNFVGDIPASNFVAGFKEGVGAAKLHCRSCLIDRDDIELIHLESNCVLRDKDTHEVHVLQIENVELTSVEREGLSTTYGVNRRCPFTRLGYVDPTKIFSHDLMHVVNEGILNLVVRKLLRHLIVTIKLDLDVVNRKISTLSCDREFTVPPPIRKKEVMDLTKLSFSSSEMGSVAIALAVVLAEFVSSDDPHYANFLLLLEITASLQCYSFSEKDLTILEKNIEIHNINHVLLYPKNRDESGKAITPKLHSLLHLANQIRMFGALRNSWCFRYESKNARFKKIMNRNCNFSNVPWSLSSHHQKLVGLDVARDGEGHFFGNMENFTVHGHHSPIDVKHAWWAHIAYETTDLISDSKFQPLKSLKIAGRICNKKTVFLMHPACSLESKPVFFRIADFFVAGNVYLVMEELVTTCFCPDRFSFCVRPLNIFAVVPCSELSFNAPMYSFYYDNEIHVIPNYYHF